MKKFDLKKRSPEVMDFEKKLLAKVIGQDNAVQNVTELYQTYLAEMTMPDRPISTLLFLGPTGSGKTRIVEATAEVLFDNPQALIKIDCAEFQHSHEISKLIGSPPGYLGHRETSPRLTQEAIDQYQTENARLSFLLFDEIEKANDALWQLLLGILDKATLTLGDNRKVDLSQCVIFMTSNLGAVEMSKVIEGGIGFMSGVRHGTAMLAATDQKISRVALDAAKRRFSPEFMNRIDEVVVFRTLNHEHLLKILGIELEEIQCRIMGRKKYFLFECSRSAKEFLLREGTDLKYGARHLKRAIERHLVKPFSTLIMTDQVEHGRTVYVNFDDGIGELVFFPAGKEKSFSAG